MPSGTLYHVPLVRTDVSENIALILHLIHQVKEWGSRCVSGPQFLLPWRIRSQSFTTNIAVSNNESVLEGDITNLPHVATSAGKATTWLWLSGSPPECDLRQHRVASPRRFPTFVYISHTGQTNSQTILRSFYSFYYLVCISKDKDRRIATANLCFVNHRNFIKILGLSSPLSDV
jgi:hypothetical protein